MEDNKPNCVNWLGYLLSACAGAGVATLVLVLSGFASEQNAKMCIPAQPNSSIRAQTFVPVGEEMVTQEDKLVENSKDPGGSFDWTNTTLFQHSPTTSRTTLNIDETTAAARLMDEDHSFSGLGDDTGSAGTPSLWTIANASLLHFEEELDLRVVRTVSTGQFELVDAKAFDARNIQVIGQEGSWDAVQPTNGSTFNLSSPQPHLRISGEVVLIHERETLWVNENSNWILSFVARKLNPTSRGFDIVLGPISQCNCQVRFEAGNTLGIYFTNAGHGLYQGSIPLPLNTTEYHVVTLMYDRSNTTGSSNEPKIQLYQDHRWVAALDNSPSYFAEFGRLGGWYQNQYLASIGFRRVYMAKTTRPLPSIQQFLLAKELL